jgi:hypothetical protein
MSNARGNGTHDDGMIKALGEPYLTPQSFFIPFNTLPWNGLQHNVAREIHD